MRLRDLLIAIGLGLLLGFFLFGGLLVPSTGACVDQPCITEIK